MAANGSVKEEILNKMSELDNITSMLTKLRTELKKKEILLMRMEEALKKSEERLERKVAEIDDKDKRLNEVEGKLFKRQEELMIQEREVQTNAILEFLSFQARELEIQDKMKVVPNLGETERLRKELKDLQTKLTEKEDELEKVRHVRRDTSLLGSQPEEISKRLDELDSLKNSLETQKQKLDDKEIVLLRREEELKGREHRALDGVSSEDRKVLEALESREKELKKLEEQVRNSKKDLSRFMEGIDIKDSKIRNLENELNMKEEMLRIKEEEVGGSAAGKDIKHYREATDKEYQTKISMIEGNYKMMVESLKNKIDQLKVRNEELEMMGDQLSAEKLRVTLLEREMKDRMNEISFSEERLARRQELMLKERKQIDEQSKKLKDMGAGTKVAELTEELSNRQKQLKDIESKLRDKEEYLRKREQELEKLRSGVIDQEMKIEAMEGKDDLNRVRTGVRRFDDLTYGGFPHNSNFILYGPAYSGRSTFTNLYISEGLKKGIPTIYITTQHTPNEVKDQLRNIIPKIDAYEEKGLVKFIDIYSRSMGILEVLPNTIYIEKPTELDAIQNALETYQSEFKGKYPYHKIVFFSVSTLLTYSEPLSIFRFFQVLNSKNKRNNASSIYIVDTGMHKESDIQTLKHVMTGFIEFKLDDLKYYLRLEGGGDVMSRAWIEYTFTDKSFDLRGSFSLDHIR
ncbi:MAG: hypothetical protein MUC62_07710 [Candidatus Thermoplasmatota archaeon]|jgi:KaiC/GvpD/RAD55 family RecA-like ATPase|nr:hypothetical protein [Candidatus Thermoplasmatota archaeon]